MCLFCKSYVIWTFYFFITNLKEKKRGLIDAIELEKECYCEKCNLNIYYSFVISNEHSSLIRNALCAKCLHNF